ncbi:MAG TPA: hypothetical protein VI341_05645, partial [Actinomycetota bacterium]
MLAALVLTIIVGSLLKTQERPGPAGSPEAGGQGRPIEDVGSPTPLASPSPMSAEVGLDVGPLSVGRHPLITEG